MSKFETMKKDSKKAEAELCTIQNVSDMLSFLSALRNTDHYIEMIYLNGACYQLHILLKEYFNCEPLINPEKNHVVTKFKDKFFDITGEVKGEYLPMSNEDVEKAKQWSFHRNKMIQICECPFCEEPIVV